MTLDLTRNTRKCVGRLGVLLFASTLSGSQLVAQNDEPQVAYLLDRLDRGWAQHWRERDVGRGHTAYQVVLDDGTAVLQGRSERSASAVWRDLDVSGVQRAVLTWRWKVPSSLSENARERERRGDDYAARVFVIFGPGTADLRRSKALCYVWAGTEAIGSAYPSPYAANVFTLVLESGDDRAGSWVFEERDIVNDYRASFGEPPDRIAAVALMVDTDDTKAAAVAFFADLKLVTNSRAAGRD